MNSSSDLHDENWSLSTQAATVAGVTLAFVVMGLLVWLLHWLLLLVFAGILVAVFLHTLAKWFSGLTNLRNGWSLAVVLLLLVATTMVAGFLVGDSLALQMSQLIVQLPESWQSMLDTLEQSEWGNALVRAFPRTFDDLPISVRELVERTTRAFTSIVGGVVGLFIILFIGIYLAFDKDLYVRGLVHLAPPFYREQLLSVLEEVGSVLQWWLLGRIIDMTFVGVLTTLGLWLLGVPLAFILGLLAAALNFVPNFGPIIAAFPAVLLGLVESPTTAVYVILLYTVVQSLESAVVTPLVQQKAVSLPPALTITTQIAFGILAGGLGVILATPITAAAMTMIRRIYVEDLLESSHNEADVPPTGP